VNRIAIKIATRIAATIRKVKSALKGIVGEVSKGAIKSGARSWRAVIASSPRRRRVALPTTDLSDPSHDARTFASVQEMCRYSHLTTAARHDQTQWRSSQQGCLSRARKARNHRG